MPLTPEEVEEKKLLEQLLVKRGARQGTFLDKLKVVPSLIPGQEPSTIGDVVRMTPDILQGIAATAGTIGGASLGGIPGALAGGAAGSAAGTSIRDLMTKASPSLFGETRKPLVDFTGNNLADEAILDTLINVGTAGAGRLGPGKQAIGRIFDKLVPDLPQDVISDFGKLRASGMAREDLPRFSVGSTHPLMNIVEQVGSPTAVERARQENLDLGKRIVQKLIGGQPGREGLGEITESQARQFNESLIRKQKPVSQAEDITGPIIKQIPLQAGTATQEQIRGANAVIKANRRFSELELGITDLDDAIASERKRLLGSAISKSPKGLQPEPKSSFELKKLETQRNALTRQLNIMYPEEFRKILRKDASEVMNAAFKNPDTARQLIEVGGKQEVREEALSRFWKESTDSKGNFNPKAALKAWRENKGLNSVIFQGRTKAQVDQFLNVSSTADRKLGELGKISLFWRGTNAAINLGSGLLTGLATGSASLGGAVSGGIIIGNELFTRKILLNPQVADAAIGLSKTRPGSKEALEYMRRLVPVLQGSKVALFRRNPDGSTEITDPNFIIPSSRRGER